MTSDPCTVMAHNTRMYPSPGGVLRGRSAPKIRFSPALR